jgi:DNA-binding transcriptional regulator YhcF (GntR family)
VGRLCRSEAEREIILRTYSPPILTPLRCDKSLPFAARYQQRMAHPFQNRFLLRVAHRPPEFRLLIFKLRADILAKLVKKVVAPRLQQFVVSRRSRPDLGVDKLGSLCILYIYRPTQMGESFIISQADKRPMYLQIMEQIKQRVAVGDWAAGQPIPSIRQLAVEIGVSVITVKRAYLELEREGVIVTRQGKGSFVASGSEVGTRIREQELAQHLEQAVRSAALLGLSPQDLEKRIKASYERVTDREKESV